jgi:hypothetical protein
MARRRCASCGGTFRPRSQHSKQRFCSQAACQRERRRRWQAAKRRDDGDYRDNQRRAQRSWAENHPDYWRQYRCNHPDYVARNRALSRQRQRERRHASRFAKMDASPPPGGVPSGTYRLVPATSGGFAKMDAWTVELTVISTGCGDIGATPIGLQREDVIGARASSC